VAAAQWEMTADELHDLDELFSRLV
jgi:hypothetical protein